jgi:hypothetical protein
LSLVSHVSHRSSLHRRLVDAGERMPADPNTGSVRQLPLEIRFRDVPADWRTNGVCVVRGDEPDTNTPQTPGMTRAAAITAARVGAEKLWAGTVIIDPDARTGAHHHGPVESIIYVVSGRARMRWGERYFGLIRARAQAPFRRALRCCARSTRGRTTGA